VPTVEDAGGFYENDVGGFCFGVRLGGGAVAGKSEREGNGVSLCSMVTG